MSTLVGIEIAVFAMIHGNLSHFPFSIDRVNYIEFPVPWQFIQTVLHKGRAERQTYGTLDHLRVGPGR